jgi:hypothetical protein
MQRCGGGGGGGGGGGARAAPLKPEDAITKWPFGRDLQVPLASIGEQSR